MSDRTRGVDAILTERLTTIAEISQLTAEHLRLTQMRAGQEIERLRDPHGAAPAALAEAEDGLAGLSARIEALELRLSRIDAELEAGMAAPGAEDAAMKGPRR